MPEIKRLILGKNLKNCRKAIPLTREELANMLQISVGSLVSLENGTRSTSLRIVNLVLNFFNFTFDDVGYSPFNIPLDFREKIIRLHSENLEFSVALTKVPPIPFAIEYKLLKGTYLNEPKETHEIKEYFEKLGWSWDGTAISTALSRNVNLGIKIQPIQDKRGTFSYSKA